MPYENAGVQQPRSTPVKELVELEQLYRTAPVGLCSLDRDLRYVRINQLLADFKGQPVEAIVGRTLDQVRPDRDPGTERMMRHVLETGEAGHDLEVSSSAVGDPTKVRHWLLNMHPLRSADGIVVGVSVVAQDVTLARTNADALRQSQAELRDLTSRLIRAQEEEVGLVARELHDDISQRLAAIAIETGRLEQALVEAGNQGAAEVGRIQRSIAALSNDVHGISRRLHPSILDDLGLPAAIEAEATSFSDRERIPVEVTATLDQRLPPSVALTLYRIVQESLRNIAKYSKASHVRITLTPHHRRVNLAIQDDGIGFDPGTARRRRGLGLASMNERCRIVDGRLTVTSKPGRGTTIEVDAPATIAG